MLNPEILILKPILILIVQIAHSNLLRDIEFIKAQEVPLARGRCLVSTICPMTVMDIIQDLSTNRWMEQDRRIQFINLPISCEIKIFTLAGDLVATILHDNPSKGYEDWNLTSDVGQTVSSGIYLFTIEDTNNGQAQIGKFVII